MQRELATVMTLSARGMGSVVTRDYQAASVAFWHSLQHRDKEGLNQHVFSCLEIPSVRVRACSRDIRARPMLRLL